ncbi:response regulator [Chitinilyticum piscinae]|uniref:Response regulator n=1 Tax=Chitinilyticum piscinae TaxID=2866724 RepID=A0A8J7KE96_9NEIS|nr:response regulator [Chitinilyticum piscinae]MBE9609249.1 response regulator [Chitinilyticum piscinae]
MPKHYSASQIHILLVEPSGVQSSVISGYLRQLGVSSIELVGSGKAALEKLRSGQYELMLSAMYLPDMTGVELLTRVRGLPDIQSLAFVLVSSETRPQMLEPVRQLGVCAIVPKPFTEAQLSRALSTTLDFLSDDLAYDSDYQHLETVKVLLVDDSRAARAYMRQVLEHLGLRDISEASNGREGMAQLEGRGFDLVITDYNMPEMDGKQLLDYIRRDSWQADIPVLMVSSEQDAGRLAAVEQAGVSGICDKPFEPATVRALLGKVLQGRNQHD